MKIPTNSGGYDGGSYERPKAGKYLGRLVRVAYIGTQPSKKFDAKPNVLMGWQLYKEVRVKAGKGYTIEVQPSLDSENYPHVIYQTYTASLSPKANLTEVVEAHLGRAMVLGDEKKGIRGDDESQLWPGLAAVLDLTESEAKDRNGNPHVNVTGVSSVNPETQEVPEATLPLEHWDLDEYKAGKAPPTWANYYLGRSTDLKDLATARKPKEGDDGANAPTPRRQLAPAAASVSSDPDDDGVPF